MIIEGTTSDPLQNLIEFTRKKREPNLVAVRSPVDACRHPHVLVEESSRIVCCKECHAVLDAFQVLWEMATRERLWLQDLETWEAMRDSRLSDRYDREWSRHAADVVEPPADPDLRRTWDTFRAVLGDKFCAMYRRRKRKRQGPTWYGRDTRGCCISLEYAKSQLVPRIAP